MKVQLLYQCFILHIIIYISGVTGEFLALSALAAGILYLKPSIIQDIQNSRLLNGNFFGGEACTDKFINVNNIESLSNDLKSQVHGQELAIAHTIGALKNHFQNRERNSKALTLSFHGLPGTGKNFITDIIVTSIFPNYKKTGTSRFVHKFNSRIHFPNEHNIRDYKHQLAEWIKTNVTACDRSIFIFDEVDKFPKGLLDVVKPYIDHHAQFNGVRFNNAMFFFLSNAGGKAIMDRFIELRTSGWLMSGKSRSDLNLNDFEQVTKLMAYNENGGFESSDVIGHNVIDHYIPFLPLEKEHVVKCIHNEYNHAKRENHRVQSVISFEDLKKHVLEGMTFVPEPDNLFSSSGCKRVKAKVGTYLARHGIYY